MFSDFQYSICILQDHYRCSILHCILMRIQKKIGVRPQGEGGAGRPQKAGFCEGGGPSDGPLDWARWIRPKPILGSNPSVTATDEVFPGFLKL